MKIHPYILVIAFVLLSCQQNEDVEKSDVVDTFFRLLKNEFYDSNFSGFDIDRIEQQAKNDSLRFADSAQLYGGLFRPILLQLESSHAGAWSSSEFAGLSGVEGSPVIEADALACFGLVVQNIRQGTPPRVVADLRRNHPADDAYPTVGWRLHGWEVVSESRLNSHWVDDAGVARDLAIDLPPNGSRIGRNDKDDSRLKTADIIIPSFNNDAREALKKLQDNFIDPESLVYYRPLGLVLTAGRAGSMPKIIGIEETPHIQGLNLRLGDQVLGAKIDKDESRVSIKLNVMRNGNSSSVTIQGQCPKESFIRDPLITTDSNVAFIRFDEFTEEAASSLRNQAAGLNAKYFIFDLRRNLGGDVLALTEILSIFFGPGHLVGFDETRGARRRLVTKGDAITDPPVHAVILTSEITGSSAEVFAYFVKSKFSGTVAGQRTAGNVLVAKLFRLPDGGVVQLPIRKFTMFDGAALEGRGVSSDASIPDNCGSNSVESCLTMLSE